MDRPRVLIVHRNNRADALRIERALGADVEVTTTWKQDKVEHLAVNPSVQRYDAIVLFPMRTGARTIHTQIIQKLRDRSPPRIFTVGRLREWNGCIENDSRCHCRSAEVTARNLREHLNLN